MNYLQKKKQSFLNIVNNDKGSVRIITGIDVLTVYDYVDEKSLINYSITGSGTEETGGVGDKTHNLLKYKGLNEIYKTTNGQGSNIEGLRGGQLYYGNGTGNFSNINATVFEHGDNFIRWNPNVNLQGPSYSIEVEPNTTYMYSHTDKDGNYCRGVTITIIEYDENGNFIQGTNLEYKANNIYLIKNENSQYPLFITRENTKYIIVNFRGSYAGTEYIFYNIQVEKISVKDKENAKPTLHDFYGYKIPIVATNEDKTQITNIYLDKPIYEGETFSYRQKQLPEIPILARKTTYSVQTNIHPTNIKIQYYSSRIIKNITGTSPLTAYDCVDEKSLINYSITGLGTEETGGVGDKTHNLLKYKGLNEIYKTTNGQGSNIEGLRGGQLYYGNGTGNFSNINATVFEHGDNFIKWNPNVNYQGPAYSIEVKPNTTYKYSNTDKDGNYNYKNGITVTIIEYNENGNFIQSTNLKGLSDYTEISSFTTSENTKYIIVNFRGTYAGTEYIVYNVQVEEGDTTTPHDFYGYKIPIVMKKDNLFDINKILKGTDYTGKDGIWTSSYLKKKDNILYVYMGANVGGLFFYDNIISLKEGTNITINADMAIFKNTSYDDNRIVVYICKKGDASSRLEQQIILNSREEYYNNSITFTIPDDGDYLVGLLPFRANADEINTDVRFKNIYIYESDIFGNFINGIDNIKSINIYLDKPIYEGETLSYKRKELPEIPIFEGNTTYDIGTSVQPKNIKIKYYGINNH